MQNKTASVGSTAMKIVDCATALFAQKNYDAVSLVEIANNAKTSKANIFHHFTNKEGLFTEVVNKITTVQADFAEKLYFEKISSSEKFWRVIELDFVKNSESLKVVSGIIEHALARNNICKKGPSGKSGEEVFCRNRLAIINIFKQGQENKEFRDDISPDIASLIYVSVISFYVRKSNIIAKMSAVQPFVKEEFALEVYKYLIAGYANPKNTNIYMPKLKNKEKKHINKEAK